MNKKYCKYNNKKIAYVDEGDGDPIIFFHGNPTSSYLYRHIISDLKGEYRCLAADMIGMGDSDKLDNSGHMTYTFQTHYEYLSTFIESLNIDKKITLVGQDWGGPLSIKWAREHPDRARGICYFETVISPIKSEQMGEDIRGLFMMLRSEKGDKKVLEENFFVEKMLGTDPIEPFSEEVMDIYRKPYLNQGEDRRPTLDWPRQIPIDREPIEVHEEVKANLSFMLENEIPKLLIIGNPGRLMGKKLIEFCRTFKNQKEATVKGNHFLQEESPKEIAEAINNWLKTI
jgi:haloalkane dehalogenase|tara:strand:+ start:4801 stop:5658 length:858 start_codon:yes stop_codon:yes gene_type:complete